MQYFVRSLVVLFFVLFISVIALGVENASSPCPEISDIHDSQAITNALIRINADLDAQNLSCVDDADGIGKQILENDTSGNTREMLDLIYKRLYKKLIYKSFTTSQSTVTEKIDEYLRDTLDLFVLNDIKESPSLAVNEGRMISDELLPLASGSLDTQNISNFRNALVNNDVLQASFFMTRNDKIESEKYTFWEWRKDGSTALSGDASITIRALSENFTSMHDYENAKDIVLKVYLVKKIFHDRNNRDILDPYMKYIGLLRTEWDNYFSDSKYQYPWELSLNSWIYAPSSGLQTPPTSQWVVMHPSLALEYMNNTNTKDSLVIEVLGMNRWGWNKNHITGEIEYPFFGGMSGGALVATYTNRSDIHVDNIGYGGVIYFKSNVSLGIIQHGNNNFGFMINIDVGKIFLTPSENDKNNNFGNVYKNVVFAGAHL